MESSYLLLKYLHILAVLGWISSTSSLGLFLLYKTFIVKDLNQYLERKFYRFLTIFELLFFALVLLLGLTLATNYNMLDLKWVRYKIMIAFGFFLPLEILNGILIFKFVKNERWFKIYDKFILLISIPLIIFGLIVIYLAVFKIN
ncbi:MAG: hypothetical protein ACP5G3_00230 [Sulfurihydrogenibium sp.]|uniref:hypothetical protein n=1 Tax=Sulfurihydrogenibium sp. TaxID=2053621 RepID=UPI000CB1E654|nr:MAG: hypothetical protein C0178_02950 [Sulfurihydrogenibium sp.]